MNKKQLKLAEELYSLGLHEWCFVVDDSSNSDIATRVPGGWIYRLQEEKIGGHIATTETFVPYNDEFNPNPPERKETRILGKKMSDFL